MRTNLSCCLGLIDNGQYKSTNRLLVLVPHERPHGIMRLLKNPCMLLPKALKMKMRAIKDTMALVADSIGGTKGAPAQMSWHLRHLNPALLNRQGMCTHPKMETGSELCHWEGHRFALVYTAGQGQHRVSSMLPATHPLNFSSNLPTLRITGGIFRHSLRICHINQLCLS